MKAGSLLKIFLAVFICKVLYFIGKRVGKGSSLPGKIVLRIFPDVFGLLKLPDTIIAVTGSNGKTTTTELIVQVLKAGGKSVAWNYEGSNQTEGVATLLLRVATYRGVVKKDAVVMECDERYAKKIFENVKPSVLLITNLCRDQLTRNGHPEFIEDCLRDAISAAGDGAARDGATGDGATGDGLRLVLNTDDPYVMALGRFFGDGVRGEAADAGDVGDGACGDAFAKSVRHYLFGVLGDHQVGGGSGTSAGMYDDGAFCPVCKARMVYDYRIAGHYGSYSCSTCGLKRGDPDVEAIVQNDGSLLINKNKMHLKLPSITGVYNFCAAVAVGDTIGLDVAAAVKALDDYSLKSGRVLDFSVGDRKGLLLLSKHENSFAYDRSLSWIAEQGKPCTVIVLVDAISRKYYTSETSWLWDIDFDLLVDESVKNVVLAGRYVNELAMRFAMTSVDPGKIGYVVDLSGLREYVENNTSGDIYVVTCFSDKVKLLDALQ